MDDHEGESDQEDVDDLHSDPGGLSGSGQPHPVTSSSREARNKAEKNRRDKLNLFIQELAMLVPSVASSPKRLDKTSILRHSAAYLRLHRINKPAEGSSVAIPHADQFDVMKHLLNELAGILFVITSSGKIVFVSDSVEKMLGHSESDLLGQSIYSVVFPADHDEVRRNLTPDEDPMDRMLASSDDSSSDDTGTSTSMECPSPEPPPPLGAEGAGPSVPPIRQKRSFFMRLRQRAVSKSDHVQYELVHARGHLCIPSSRSPPQPQPQLHGHRRRSHESSNSNDIVLFAVIQLVRERRISEQSLLEATKEEYITRHTMDGRIIYCDHRISLVAGYLSDEVAGLSAFNYMHKDDVRWTMVALRHMLNRCEDYGSSCYRLKSKTGDFIYLKTFGYLEKDNETQALNSFICVNVLVTPEEGEEAIRDMHKRFSPLIVSDDKPRKSGVVIKELPDEEEPATESEETLAPLVNELLLSTIPEPHSPHSPSAASAPNEQYAKVTFVSKNLPPVSIHTAMVGIKDVPSIPVPGGVAHSPRQPPQSPTSAGPHAWSPRHVEDHGLTHTRPSVLCATGNILSSEGSRARAPIISGLKRPLGDHQREEETKKTRTRRQRVEGDLARGPLSVDVGPSLPLPHPLRGASPASSPPSRGGVFPYSSEAVSAFPNGAWGRSGQADQARPALMNPESDSQCESPDFSQTFDLFQDGEIPNIEGFPLDMDDGQGVPVIQQIHELPHAQPVEQQGKAVRQQLILHQYQLQTDLDMQEEQITSMDQGLNQVPVDNPERRMIANSLVELKVERNRQEKILKELTRETLGV